MTHKTVHETDIESAILALQRIQETILGRMRKIESRAMRRLLTGQSVMIDEMLDALKGMRESEGLK